MAGSKTGSLVHRLHAYKTDWLVHWCLVVRLAGLLACWKGTLLVAWLEGWLAASLSSLMVLTEPQVLQHTTNGTVQHDS